MTDPKNRQTHSGFRHGHYPSSVAELQHPTLSIPNYYSSNIPETVSSPETNHPSHMTYYDNTDDDNNNNNGNSKNNKYSKQDTILMTPSSKLIEGYVPPPPLSSTKSLVPSNRSPLLDSSAVIPSHVPASSTNVSYNTTTSNSPHHQSPPSSHQHPIHIPCMNIYEHIVSCHVCSQIYANQKASTFSFVAHILTVLSVILLLIILIWIYTWNRTFLKWSPLSFQRQLSTWWKSVVD